MSQIHVIRTSQIYRRTKMHRAACQTGKVSSWCSRSSKDLTNILREIHTKMRVIKFFKMEKLPPKNKSAISPSKIVPTPIHRLKMRMACSTARRSRSRLRSTRKWRLASTGRRTCRCRTIRRVCGERTHAATLVKTATQNRRRHRKKRIVVSKTI